jgi:hypothetical protein
LSPHTKELVYGTQRLSLCSETLIMGVRKLAFLYGVVYLCVDSCLQVDGSGGNGVTRD